MTSKIGGFIGGGNWKHAHGTAHYGRNFAIKWLKLSELSFDKTRHLRNPYNENLPVKISRDCQELEPSIGEQLASLLYIEPDSDLTAVLVAAEAKREPENGRGTSADNGAENPDIVPFEDNEEEEEEEEESEEEEDNSLNIYGVQGRGRARGIGMWPHIPIARGARPFTGFPPGMMGDGFAYGPDGYPMAADPFGMASRGFGHFGPRFPGNFPVPTAPGMMFPARPTGGFGMVMRPAPPGHGGVGMVPFYQQPPPLQQSSNRAKKDQIAAPVDRNYQQTAGSDDGAGNEGAKMSTRNRYEDHYSGGNNYKNESESEDEAPRRSRHGESKKKRRSLEETDSTAVSAEG